jgi:hypothetical protein
LEKSRHRFVLVLVKQVPLRGMENKKSKNETGGRVSAPPAWVVAEA